MGVRLDLCEVSKRLEVDPKTICALAKAGLVSAERDETGYLFFDETEVARLDLILSLKNDWGYSISTLKSTVFRGVHHRTCEISHSM